MKERKECPRCGRNSYLTRDHIIPVAIIKIAKKYGIPSPEEKQRIEMVCQGCNGERGHRIIDDSAQDLKNAILTKAWAENIYISAQDLMILRSANSNI